MNELTSAQAWQQAQAQGTLKPGAEGWWRVWGAGVGHVRPGDLVLLPGDVPTLITGRWDCRAAPVRAGFVSAEGDRFTLGALARLVILRRGTHNTLA